MTELSLTGLINAAVAQTMQPDFIEKEVHTRVQKLIVESIDKALRTYSDTGKLIEKAIEEALRVDKIDLPSYGSTVLTILKAQIEGRVAEIAAGRLAEDMQELLSLAPKEITLSKIADEMRERHDGSEWGNVITVHVEPKNYGSTWVYLDDETHHERRAEYECPHAMLIREDGTIACARVDKRPLNDTHWVGQSYGIAQKIRAYVACGTKIILDEENVCVSVGDY